MQELLGELFHRVARWVNSEGDSKKRNADNVESVFFDIIQDQVRNHGSRSEKTMGDGESQKQENQVWRMIPLSQRFHDIALEAAKIIYAKRPVVEDSSLLTTTTFDFFKDYLGAMLILNDLWVMVQEASLSEKCDSRENQRGESNDNSCGGTDR